MSSGFIGDRPRGHLHGRHGPGLLPLVPRDGDAPDTSPAVARALARARLRRFVDQPVVTRAALATFGLAGVALVAVPGRTATRLPESLAPTLTVSRTAYVLAVVAIACGVLALALTAVLAARTLRLGGDGSVAVIAQSVAVCTSAPDDLTSRQRSDLIELLQEVADQLRRLSDATTAQQVEMSCALLEGHHA